MKHHYLGLAAAGILAAASLTACDRANPPATLSATKITRANFNQIPEKASKAQVQAILGEPSSQNTEDKVIYKRTTWRYLDGDKYINITFKNDEMDGKETNLGT